MASEDQTPRWVEMTRANVADVVTSMKARGVPPEVIRKEVIALTRDHLRETYPEGNPDPAIVGLAESYMAEVQRVLTDLGI